MARTPARRTTARRRTSGTPTGSRINLGTRSPLNVRIRRPVNITSSGPGTHNIVQTRTTATNVRIPGSSEKVNITIGRGTNSDTKKKTSR